MLSAALLGFLIGAALQLQESALLPPAAYYAVLIAALTLLFTLKRIAAQAGLKAQIAQNHLKNGLLCLCMAAIAFASTGLRATARLADRLAPELIRQDLLIEGHIVGLPQSRGADTQFIFKPSKAELNGQAVRIPQRLSVSWYGNQKIRALANSEASTPLSRQPIESGQRWRLQLRLKPIHGNINPHGFDYELYMFERQIGASGYVRSAHLLQAAPSGWAQVLPQNWGSSVARLRASVRSAIAQQVPEPRQAGVLAALVMGEQSAIERRDWDLFRATGVAHLMSISGLHITLFAWLAMLCTKWLWRRSTRLMLWQPTPYAAWVGGLLCASAYAAFTGWGVPAQRTCLMLLVVCLLRLSGKRWPWRVQLLLAAAVVVAFEPWALLQAGFWLSFVAVGILFLGDEDKNASHADDLSALGTTRPWYQPLLRFVQVQGRISWALAPLSLLLFHQFSLVGIVANLLAIPLVTFVITPLALLGTLLPSLWPVAASVLGLLIAFLQWCQRWPYALIYSAATPLWLGLAAIIGAIVLLVPRAGWWRWLGLPFVIATLFYRPATPAVGEFEALALDIGQGNAVLLRTATHSLLYDTGPSYGNGSSAGERVIVPLLRALGTAPDAVVISHKDADHSGGAAAVLAAFDKAQVYTSMQRAADWPSNTLVERCLAGRAWVWDGVRLEFLHPTAEDYAAGRSSNAMSCVLRVSNGRHSMLLVGDIPQQQELAIIARTPPAQLRSTILLAAHHGSKTSSSAEFLQAVAPAQIWLQTGYLNRYGHPATAVMARYADAGLPSRNTASCGAIRWQSSQPDSSSCTRRERPRYWWHQVPASGLAD